MERTQPECSLTTPGLNPHLRSLFVSLQRVKNTKTSRLFVALQRVRDTKKKHSRKEREPKQIEIKAERGSERRGQSVDRLTVNGMSPRVAMERERGEDSGKGEITKQILSGACLLGGMARLKIKLLMQAS